jgi:hypothetical protein
VRRAICIIAILFIATVVTGLGYMKPHTGVSILFVFSAIAHIMVNIKTMAKHLKG